MLDFEYSCAEAMFLWKRETKYEDRFGRPVPKEITEIWQQDFKEQRRYNQWYNKLWRWLTSTKESV